MSRDIEAKSAKSGAPPPGPRLSPPSGDDTDSSSQKLDKGYVPYGVTSFAELAESRQLRERLDATRNLWDDFVGIAENLLYGDALENASQKLKNLFDEFVELIPPEGTPAPFTILKSIDGTYRWQAIYSNNLRDVDGHLIRSSSHEAFAYLVKDGTFEYPEVWVWHIPGTAWGRADVVGTKENNGVTYAYAAGGVYPGKEHIAKGLMERQKTVGDLATSHGMPYSSIVWDGNDICFHATKEISPLPRLSAANKHTGFQVFVDLEKELAMNDRQKEFLKAIGIKGDEMDEVEKAASSVTKDVQLEKEAEVEGSSAEKPAPAAAEVVEKQEEVEAEESGSVDSVKSAITREEIAEVLGEVLKGVMAGQSELVKRLSTLEKAIEDIGAGDDQRMAKMMADTPPTSLHDMIVSSVIGKDAAKVDGRTSLAKSAPAETSAPGETGLFFNQWLANQ